MGNGERYEVVAISGGGGGGSGGGGSSSSSSTCRARDAFEAFAAEISARKEVFNIATGLRFNIATGLRFNIATGLRFNIATGLRCNIATGLRFENRSVWSFKDLKHNGG